MKGSQSVVGGGAPHRERPCELSLSELSPQPSHPSSSTPQTVPLETKTQVGQLWVGALKQASETAQRGNLPKPQRRSEKKIKRLQPYVSSQLRVKHWVLYSQTSLNQLPSPRPHLGNVPLIPGSF